MRFFDSDANISVLCARRDIGTGNAEYSCRKGMFTSMYRKLSVLFLGIVLCAAGCGGAFSSVGPPWRSEDAQFFDDGIDLIENPTVLSGAWGDRQKNWTEGRIQLADVVAAVEISAVQSEVDVDKNEARRIDAVVSDILYGSLKDRQVSLKSPSASPGFGSILRNEKQLNGRFILFYRTFEIQGEDGEKALGHHFHLSPASSALLEYVTQRVSLRVQAEAKAQAQRR
jgi:hypothetical protein